MHPAIASIRAEARTARLRRRTWQAAAFVLAVVLVMGWVR